MDRHLWNEYADRIESAWTREHAEIEANALAVGGLVEAERQRVVVSKTETTTVGNAAAIREALEDSQSLLESFSRGEYGAQVREQMRDNRAALAAPARNCDVFADALWDTIQRAWQDWLLTPEFNKRKIGGLKEFCYWFLGPAKKEKADGKSE